jgi:stress-induced-phosphoprotein 1
MSNREAALAAKAVGNAHFSKGEYEPAIKAFTEAIGHDANDHVFFSNRSACYASLEKYEEALADGEACIKIKPDWAKGYSRKGLAQFHLKQFEEAKTTYGEGLKLDPNNAANKEGLQKAEQALQPANPMGQLFGEQMWGRLAANPTTREFLNDPAFVQKLKLLQTDPNAIGSAMGTDPRMQQALGVILGMPGGFGGAGGPGGPAPMEDEGGFPDVPAQKEPEPEPEPEKELTEEEKADKAEREQIAQEKKAEAEEKAKVRASAEAEKKKGNEFYKKRKFDEALGHYNKAIELDPSHMSVRTNVAAVRFEQKNYDECIKVCQEAIKLGKSQYADFKLVAKAYLRLGNAFTKKGSLEEAKDAYQSSLLEDYTDAAKIALRKVTARQKKEEEAAYLDKDKSMAAKAEGNEFFKAGKWVDAIGRYSEAIKRDPTNHPVYSNRAA